MADAKMDRGLERYMEHLNIHESNCSANIPLPLRKKLDLVVHASRCGSARCERHDCGRAKRLLRHAVLCKRGATCGRLCSSTWRLLQLHTLVCKQSNFRDLPERLARLRQKQERRRRLCQQKVLHRQVERLGSLQLQAPTAEDAPLQILVPRLGRLQLQPAAGDA